jgi:hypothetical protein
MQRIIRLSRRNRTSASLIVCESRRSRGRIDGDVVWRWSRSSGRAAARDEKAQVSSGAENRVALDDRLVAFLEAQETEGPNRLTDTTSLIKSGLLDSLAVFNLTAWVEREIDGPRSSSVRLATV